MVFVNLAATDNGIDGEPNFGHYGNYADDPYQIIGCFIVAFTLFLFTLGVVFRNAFNHMINDEVIKAVELANGTSQGQKEIEIKVDPMVEAAVEAQA
mmetsp:Transcript_19442/g.29965  ORF Transcript_19442/g.29965 Transcript_19442/m.29965 type:complete len:97 (-) Transcript_19442:240-530(-)